MRQVFSFYFILIFEELVNSVSCPFLPHLALQCVHTLVNAASVCSLNWSTNQGRSLVVSLNGKIGTPVFKPGLGKLEQKERSSF